MQALVIALLIFLVVWKLQTDVEANRAANQRARAEIARLDAIATSSQRSLSILLAATGPQAQKKTAALLAAFFQRLHQEIQQGFANIQIEGGTVVRVVTSPSPVPGPTKTVVITKCVRPSGRPC